MSFLFGSEGGLYTSTRQLQEENAISCQAGVFCKGSSGEEPHNPLGHSMARTLVYE